MNNFFRQAAKLVDSGKLRYSCMALAAVTSDNDELINEYARRIAPDGMGFVLITDFEAPLSFRSDDTKSMRRARAHRVMALLMIGEAWEDMGE